RGRDPPRRNGVRGPVVLRAARDLARHPVRPPRGARGAPPLRSGFPVRRRDQRRGLRPGGARGPAARAGSSAPPVVAVRGVQGRGGSRRRPVPRGRRGRRRAGAGVQPDRARAGRALRAAERLPADRGGGTSRGPIRGHPRRQRGDAAGPQRRPAGGGAARAPPARGRAHPPRAPPRRGGPPRLARIPATVRSAAGLRREGEQPDLYGSPARLRDETGWAPAIPLTDTLRDTLDWWRAREEEG